MQETDIKIRGGQKNSMGNDMIKSVEKLNYMDGIKAVACLMVFNFHFLMIFYPGFYTLNPDYFRLGNLEHILGSAPFISLLANGKYGVRIFMTLSGFFVGYRFFLSRDKKSLATGAFKKYFRLVLPILAVNIVIYALMAAGAYQNREATALTGAQELFGNYNQFAPDFLGAVKEAVWGCFITGENKYNGPLWFIYYEFLGTIMMAAVLSMFGESKARYVIYGVLGVLFIRSDFLPFLLGTVVCDLTYGNHAFIRKLTEKKWLMWFVLIAALFLGSYPSIGERLEGSIYQHFPPKVMLYYTVSAAAALFAVLHLEAFQRLFGKKVFVAFHKYSYGFYLTHVPVFCTLSCGLYLLWYDSMNYYVLTALIYLLSIAAAFIVSWLVSVFVERPGLKMAEKMGKIFMP